MKLKPFRYALNFLDLTDKQKVIKDRSVLTVNFTC